MEIKITRKQTLLHVNNDMTTVTYVMINARLTQGDLYMPIKFIAHVFGEDLYDDETGEIRDYKDVLEEIAFCFIESYAGPDIHDQHELIDACNATIHAWNAQYRYAL